MISRFRLFESLYEGAQSRKEITDLVKKAIGATYVIKDFEEMVRPNEPEQSVDLVSDKSIHTISLNFTADDKLYSMDFWLPNSSKPVSTLYMTGLKLTDVLEKLPEILEDPSPKVLEAYFVKGKGGFQLQAPAEPRETKSPAESKMSKKEQESLYKYGDPKTIFKDFKKYTRMVIDGKQPALLVTGSAGVGKSTTVRLELEDAGMEKGKDWVKIKGKTTAAAIYISLYKNNGKLLIYDDCDSVFDDKDAINTLKGALDSDQAERDISWDSAKEIKDPSTGEAIPKSFNFNGRVIFLSNLPQKKIDPAIKSRAFVIEVALSPDDMMKYVEEKLPYMLPNVPMSTKKLAMNIIKSVSETNKNVQLNMRTVEKAVNILNEVDDLKDAKRMIIQQCSYD